MSSSLAPGKWVTFVAINIIVSIVTGLIVIRVLNQEPGQPQAGPVVITATPAPIAAAPAGDPGAAPATLAPASVNAAAPADPGGQPAPAAAGAVPETAAATDTSAPPTPEPTAAQASVAKVRISAVQFPGQRTREFVSILNEGDQIDMTGWTIVAPNGTSYVFKTFVLFRDSFISLYTTTGADSPTNLFWNQGEAMWNKGDIVTLKNGDQVVATYTVK
jgi:Lamin Tail Domain